MSKLKASEIAEFLGEPLLGDDCWIEGVSSLNNLRPSTMCFTTSAFEGRDLPSHLLMLVPSGVAMSRAAATALVIVDNPREAYAKVVDRFFYQKKVGISPSAVIGRGVTLGHEVFVGEGVIIEDGVVIGDDSVIDHGVIIGWGTTIGDRCRIGANVVIGHDGLGTFKTAEGVLRNVRHLGRATIKNGVEIGPMSTVARGTIDETVIGENTHIGPQVNIGHNALIGRNCQIAGRAQISGGVVVGDCSTLWASCTIKDGVTLSRNAVVGMGALVSNDVQEGQTVASLSAISLMDLAKFIHSTKWGR